jgi:hypothetical protein
VGVVELHLDVLAAMYLGASRTCPSFFVLSVHCSLHSPFLKADRDFVHSCLISFIELKVKV